jgi:hypothetical protein
MVGLLRKHAKQLGAFAHCVRCLASLPILHASSSLYQPTRFFAQIKLDILFLGTELAQQSMSASVVSAVSSRR